MNCADYRRRLAADPDNLDAASAMHRAECPACAALTERAQAFEARLTRALSVRVPDGFEQRLLATLRQAPEAAADAPTRTAARPRSRWLPVLGLAASLLLALLAGFGSWSLRRGHDLPAQAVAHMLGGEYPVLARTQTLSDSEVAAGFAGRNVALDAPPPAGVTYVHDCMVGGFPAVHVVMHRDHEPVTVLYVLGTRRRRGDYHRDGWEVRMLPAARGTLVMLARNDAPFAALQRGWREALEGAAPALAGAP